MKLNRDWPGSLKPVERLAEAQSRISAMIDNLSGLLHLHEANETLIFTDAISSQARGGGRDAIYGFRVLAASLLRSEISSLCTFWDSPREDRYCLPSVARLIDDEPTLDVLDDYHRNLAVQAITHIRAAEQSELLKAVRDFRDVVLAHSLNPKARRFPHLKIQYGDERKLLDLTLTILDPINLAIRNSDFDWDNTRRIARRYTESFWRAVKVEG